MPYLLQSDRKRPDGAIRCALHSLSYKHEGSLSTQRSIFLHQRIASNLLEMARYQDAERLLNQTLLASRQIFGNEDSVTASITRDLAGLHESQRNYDEAERLYKSAYAISVTRNGQEHPDTILSLQMLAIFYWIGPRRLSDAKRLLTEVVAMRERVFGPTHPKTVDSVVALAHVYSDAGRFKEAAPLYRRAVRICRGDRHYDRGTTANALGKLASYYRIKRKYRKAEAVSLEAYEIFQSVYGSEHPGTILYLSDLAHHYGNTGNAKRGEKILLETLPLLAKTLGTEHPQYINALTSLARFYFAQRNCIKSLSMWTEALDVSKRTFGYDHPITTQVADELEKERRYQMRAVERCRMGWLMPTVKTKKSRFIAALIGFLFGGIGLGLYFRTLFDFLYPTLMFFIMLLVSPPHAIFCVPFMAAWWGMMRAKDSCDDQCPCRALGVR